MRSFPRAVLCSLLLLGDFLCGSAHESHGPGAKIRSRSVVSKSLAHVEQWGVTVACLPAALSLSRQVRKLSSARNEWQRGAPLHHRGNSLRIRHVL